MNLKNIFLIILLIMAFSLAIGQVNALKIEHNGPHTVYSDGFKKVSAKGYAYHGGKLHKNMKSSGYDWVDFYCYNGYNKKCKFYGYTDIGYWSVTGTVAEMKKVNYASIKVNGKYYNKKVKLYYDERSEGTGYEGTVKSPQYQPTNFLKGNLKGKTVTLGVHDKNGKLLKSKSFNINKVTTYYYAGA